MATANTKKRKTTKEPDVKHNRVEQFIQNYQPEKASIPERVATVLFALRKIAPKVCFPKNIITKAVLGLSKTPTKGGDKEEMVSNAIDRARIIMRERYGCSIYAERNVGIRATVDDDDQAETRVAQTARRLVAQHKHLAAEASIVNPTKLTNPSTKKWFVNEVQATTALLEADDRIKKLLLPKPEEDEAETKKG